MASELVRGGSGVRVPLSYHTGSDKEVGWSQTVKEGGHGRLIPRSPATGGVEVCLQKASFEIKFKDLLEKIPMYGAWYGPAAALCQKLHQFCKANSTTVSSSSSPNVSIVTDAIDLITLVSIRFSPLLQSTVNSFAI